MKELEKQFNKDIKNPANFSFDRRSYMAGGRAALKWALSQQGQIDWRFSGVISPEIIKKELEDEN